MLLATREIGEAPLVLWWTLSQEKRRARTEQPMANLPGKAATVLQFATVAHALFGGRYLDQLLYATAVAGGLAALSYWLRELRVLR